MSAIFGIAGYYSSTDILKMQKSLAQRARQEPVVKKFENGFLGCIGGTCQTTSHPENDGCSVCVTDGYIVSGSDDHCLSDIDQAGGLYASAVFESLTNHLCLYRDPSGARPLYYAIETDRCIFASQPKAILAVCNFNRELSPAGIALYLSMICPPDPVTIYKSVKMLRPGYRLDWRNNTHSEQRFWTPSPTSTTVSAKDPAIFASDLRNALEKAVMDSIPADHSNTGFFLSGGTDTGAVVALAAKHGVNPIKTYTIGYEGSGAGYDDYNEFYYAKLIADHYKTNHHEFTISPQTVIQSLPGIVSNLDQPSGDAINTYLVAGVLPSDIHTVLTGTGGDEIFIGSHWFKQQARLQTLYNRWSAIPVFLRNLILSSLKHSRHKAANRIRRLAALEAGVPAQYQHFKMLFDPKHILTPDYFRLASKMESGDQIVALYDELHKNSDDINRMESLLFHHEVSNLQLRDVDSMSHAHGIEARSPLVDRRVLDVLNAIPGHVKAPDGKLRYLMFQALGDCLLTETKTRKKMSFIVPMDLWARRELKPAIEHLLSREVVLKRGILSPDAVEQEKEAYFKTGLERHPFKVWNLALLELWCRYHIDAPPDSSPPASLDDLL